MTVAGVRVDPTTLAGRVAAAFERVGAPDDIARDVARLLVDADLAGHASHGVLHVPRYVARAAAGEIDAAARPTELRRAGGTAVWDGRRGFGHILALRGGEAVVELANEHGVAAVALTNAGHIGRIGAYVERIAQAGLIGLAVGSGTGPGGPVVAPHGGRTALLATNPIAIAVPTAGAPVLVDMATAAIAGGKIAVAQSRGEALPEGTVIDRDGRASTSPRAFYEGGAQLPFGGHKGYALSFVIELVANLLAGSPPASSSEWTRPGNPAVLLGIAIDRFVDPGWFTSLAAELADRARSLPTAEGFTAVEVPGDRSRRNRDELTRSGVPLTSALWQEIQDLAEGKRT